MVPEVDYHVEMSHISKTLIGLWLTMMSIYGKPEIHAWSAKMGWKCSFASSPGALQPGGELIKGPKVNIRHTLMASFRYFRNLSGVRLFQHLTVAKIF